MAKAPAELHPLSFSQERLWFIDKLEGTIPYHIPAAWRLKGDLNKEALNQAFKEIVNRHEVLRTNIIEKEAEPSLLVMDAEGWKLHMVNDLWYSQSNENLQQRIHELASQPFNLSKDYMIRAHLIMLAEDENVLIVTLHHIAADGWSISVLVKELMELYNAYIERRPALLFPLPIQYGDYSLWQRNYLQGEVLKKKLTYWEHKLEGVAVLELPTDYLRPVERSNRGAVLGFSIDKILTDQLKALNRQEGTTLFMTMLAAFKILLHRYSGQEDICVGSPIANRTQKEIEDLIGFFINTLALRSKVKSDMSFKELLQQIRDTTMEAYEHQDVPFEKVVGAVVKERDMNRNPLFQVMLVMQNTPKVDTLYLGDIPLASEEFLHDTTHFDLSFSISESGNSLNGSVEYSTDLYTEETIKRMVLHFKTLLGSIVKYPQQNIGLLPMLTKAEEHQLLIEFNDTATEYPKDKTIVDLFEEQALKTPDTVALVFEEEKLTYKELNDKSNQLAHYLKSKGVKEGILVPICIEKSVEMIIGILGILKAGGAYVPIDPVYPEDRISYMLEDTQAKIIVTSKKSEVLLPEKEGIEIVDVNGEWMMSRSELKDNTISTLAPNQLAYVIYTSGSTGKPKGVMITHGNVVSLVKGIDYISLTDKDILLSTGSSSFDATTFEYWGMLLNGGKLILCSEEILLNSELLKEELQKREVTAMWCTARWFDLLVDNDITVFQKLKILLVGGEKLSEKHIYKFRESYPSIKIINGYGPTENTTFSLTYNITQISNSIPVGRPLNNRSAYILDHQQQLVPIGVVGELCVGGAGLSTGYLTQPDLTREKFVHHPFSNEASARIYKTGDMGKWLPDGNIQYTGRIDDQVKIRGYRIELGEIESALLLSGQLHQAVIIAHDNKEGSKNLVGYVVPKGIFDKGKIITFLKSKLPEYMIPGMWVTLESLPLTPNGKIDKKALPHFDSAEVLSQNYIAPRDETERMIAEIWEEVLAVEKVGMKNNFFELGGHSLVILKLASKIRNLGLKIDVKDFFKYQTIEQQSDFIKTSFKLLETASKGKFVIPIQTEGNNVPMFGIPEFLLYSKIGKHISKNQPFYSIENFPYETSAEIVNHYITQIKTVYPHGPYGLMGYCAWGDVILEMAQTLIAQGDEVPVLVLIEYFSPSIKLPKTSSEFIRQKVKFMINTLRKNDSVVNKRKFLFEHFIFLLKFIRRKFSRTGKKIEYKQSAG
ncbi:MAG: amino acid adenylation domain-containing protein [Chitinophagaceae bacterium]